MKLSPKAKERISRWTPDGYECPICEHFNHVVENPKLSDHLGEPCIQFEHECKFCSNLILVTTSTVTNFLAEKHGPE